MIPASPKTPLRFCSQEKKMCFFQPDNMFSFAGSKNNFVKKETSIVAKEKNLNLMFMQTENKQSRKNIETCRELCQKDHRRWRIILTKYPHN
jgi:hypothetical protein